MTTEEYEACWEQMKTFAPKSVSWSHYDLARETDINDIELWKEFLFKRDVVDWLTEERTLLQSSELAKLSTDVSKSRSVGQAQLISAMQRIDNANKEETASGPAYIYTYIPLNTEQEHAPNVQILTEDIFHDKYGFEFGTTAPTVPT